MTKSRVIVAERFHRFQLLQPLLLLDIVWAGVVFRVDSLHESSLNSKVCSSMFGFDRSDSLLEVRPEEWKRHSVYDAFGDWSVWVESSSVRWQCV
jgi:hypothetical protein